MIKKMAILGAGVLLLWPAAGTRPLAGQAQAGQTQGAGGRRTARVLDALVSHAEEEIVPAAEAMPEEKYAFAPSGGEFKGVRTFAAQVKHLAAANYQLAARILGEKLPGGTVGAKSETAPDTVQSKPQVVEYLKASFAYLHKAALAIDAENEVEPIPGVRGAWQQTRLGSLVDAIAHDYDHYGQMVEYLRMNGIVPPASR